MLKNPVFLLRLEGLALLAASALTYSHLNGNWWHFFLLLLVPDLSMLGYAFNVRVGAAVYNLAHTSALPLALAAAALLTHHDVALPYLLIWTAHLGMDRVLGYGLKFPTHFQDTHLQRL
jgi:hypothetical protein